MLDVMSILEGYVDYGVFTVATVNPLILLVTVRRVVTVTKIELLKLMQLHMMRSDELAAMLGVHDRTIRRYLQGVRIHKMAELAIKHALECRHD